MYHHDCATKRIIDHRLVIRLAADEKQRQFVEEDGPLEMTPARVDRDVVSPLRTQFR